jgi:tripartite-type tricarboxylate transporter receptor subunit TctC
MPFTRRALAAALLAPAIARAQPAWPTRPVRFLVPYPPGGGTDVLARALAEVLRPALPQPIVVENRAGAQGAIGSEVIARAEADGHHLLVATSTHTLNKYQLQQLSYDPLRDFAPVAKLTRQTLVLVAGTSQPFADLAGLLRLARERPGQLGFGATEALTSFAGHELNRLANVRMEEIQYRGGGLVMNDLIAGHLPTGWTSTASAQPHLAGGRVRVLGVSTATRTPVLPDAPTIAEQGVAGYDLSSWVGMFAPANTPAPVTERIHAALAAAYGAPALQARFAALGLEPDLLAPAAFAAFLRQDDSRWAAAASAGRIVKAQ